MMKKLISLWIAILLLLPTAVYTAAEEATVVVQLQTTEQGRAADGFSMNGVSGWLAHGGAYDYPGSGTGLPSSFPTDISGVWRWRLNDSGTGQFGVGLAKTGGGAIDTAANWANGDYVLEGYMAAMADYETAATNKRLAVAVLGNDYKTILLSVPLTEALFENQEAPSYEGNDGNWKKLSVPLKYFQDNGTLMDPNGTGVTAFPWEKLNGIYFLCDTVTNGRSILRTGGLQIVKTGDSAPAEIAVTGMNEISGAATVEENATAVYTASVIPADATNQNIIWSVISGTGNASITAGGVLTAISAGTVTVKAAAEGDPSIYREKTVTVTAAETPIPPVTPTVPSATMLVSRIQTTEQGRAAEGYSVNGISGWLAHGGAYDYQGSQTALPPSFPEGVSGTWRWRLNDSGTGQFGAGFARSNGGAINNTLDWANGDYVLEGYMSAMADYNSAATNQKIALAVRGNDTKTILLAVPLTAALFENNEAPSYVSNSDANWKKLSVPLQYFRDNGTLIDPNGTGVTEFPWANLNGVFFLCDTMTNGRSILRVCDLKLTAIDRTRPKAAFEKNNTTVAPNETIEITFDAPMNIDTFLASHFEISGDREVTGVEWSADTKTITLQFDDNFTYGMTYTLRITDHILGANGNPVDSTTREFTFSVISEAEYDLLSDAKLNSDTLTAADAKTYLEDARLGLDLTDYWLSYVDRERVAELFVKYRQGRLNSVEEVQKLLDKAVGMVLLDLETDATKMMDWILKYGESSGISSEFLADYQSASLTKAARKQIAAVLCSEDLRDETKINDSFAEAAVVTFVNDSGNTWSTVKSILTDKYQAYIDFDPAVITKAGVEEAAFYKEMLNQNYKNMQALLNDVPAILERLSTPEDDTPSRGGGRGGGGGGSAATITKPFTAAPEIPVLPEIVPEEEPEEFTDLDTAAWAADAIHALADRGIISRAAYFRPQDNITRAEYTKLIVLSFSLLEEAATCDFSDVAATDWSYPYIASAKTNGVIFGTSDSAFSPEAPITRQDMATILYRVLKQKYSFNDAVPEVEVFSDEGEIGDYAKDAVSVMRALRIIEGVGENKFAPTSFATRAEASMMLYKADEICKEIQILLTKEEQ